MKNFRLFLKYYILFSVAVFLVSFTVTVFYALIA